MEAEAGVATFSCLALALALSDAKLFNQFGFSENPLLGQMPAFDTSFKDKDKDNDNDKDKENLKICKTLLGQMPAFATSLPKRFEIHMFKIFISLCHLSKISPWPPSFLFSQETSYTGVQL